VGRKNFEITMPAPEPPAAVDTTVNEAEQLRAIIRAQRDIMTSQEDLPTVMQLVCDRTMALTRAEAVGLALLDGGELVFKAAGGTAAPFVGIRVKPESSISGWCLRTGQISRIDDSEADERTAKHATRAVGARSIVTAPLFSGGKVVGALSVLSPRVGAFAERDEHTLSLMSVLIGAALGRAAEAEARRAARAAEEAQAAILRSFYESAPFSMGIVELVGDDFRYLSVNTRSQEFLGLPPSAVEGKTNVELGAPAEKARDWAERMRETLREQRAVRFEDPTSGPGGNRIYSATIAPLPGGPSAAPRFCFVLEDVSDRRRMQAHLELSDRMASVGRLASGVAHEVNNPLSVVMANLRFLAEELGRVDGSSAGTVLGELREVVTETETMADRVRRIVRDLQALASSGGEARGVVRIEQAVSASVTMATHTTRQRANVVVDLDPLPPVLGSEARLTQLFVSLVVNAAEAIPPGNVEGNEIRITAREGSGGVVVEVRDTGCGIDPAHLAHVFDPFYTTKPVGNGMGLGLSSAHGIVTAHGGILSVESEVGKGSVFRVWLPPAVRRVA
jgi:PAS domain S-box-containing protein